MLWRVTYTFTKDRPPGLPVEWNHTFHEVEAKSEKQAKYRARQLAKKMWPSARARVGRITRDRKAEARQEKIDAEA